MLLPLFSRLTRSEYQAFMVWLAHRRHRKLKLYRDVCNYLWHDLAKLGEAFATLDLNKLYERCFPDRTYKDAHWRRFAHELRLELETFLLDRRNARDPDQMVWDKLTLYRKLGLERHHTLTLAKARRDMETSDKCGAEQLLHAYQLERTAYRSGLLQTERTGSNSISDHSDLLDRAILAFHLRQICEQLSAARLHTHKDQTLEKQAKDLVERAQKYSEEPAISVYAKATQLYISAQQEEGDEHFDAFQKHMSAQLHRFNAEEQRDLLLIAINHGLRQANAGRREYLPKLFELYKKGLEDEILLEHGRLSIFTFNNAFGASIHVNRMDWAKDYLFTLQSRLPKERGSEVVALAKARMAYIQQDYDQVLIELQKADYRDFIHHMTARVTQLKAYLALDYYHLAESLISGTRQLLRRHSDRSYHYKNYRNIFTLAAGVLKLSAGNHKARQKLITRIQETQPCTEKKWLLAQIEDEIQ